MSDRGTVAALIPVKGGTDGKGRLARLLSAAEREALARAMLQDVVTALLGSQLLNDIAVISPDAAMLAFAASLGARSLAEPAGAGGLNAALRGGVAQLQRQGAQSVLIVQGDVPGIVADDVAALLERPTREPCVRAAPCADGGTAALLLAPPDAIAPAFGPDSFARHRATALAAGIPFERCSRPGLALDVDRPEDLTAARGQQTRRLLRQLSIAGRLRTALASPAGGGGA